MFNIAGIAHAMASKVPNGNQLMQAIGEKMKQGATPASIISTLEQFCPEEKKHILAKNQIWNNVKQKQNGEEIMDYSKSLGKTVLKDVGIPKLISMGIPLNGKE